MDENISSGGGRGKYKRYWTTDEDNVIVDALSELANDPQWKCDNGFQNGYMVRLEEMIGKTLPNCGLKALSHIDSRIKTLVTKFKAIAQMLSTSGFKWDDEKIQFLWRKRCMMSITRVIQIVKSYTGKPFPYLNTLMEIYSKDYATGKSAEGFSDAVQNMEKTVPSQVVLDSSNEDDTNASDNVFQTSESAPPSKKMKRENSLKHKGKKKAYIDSELLSLQGFMKDMNVHLSTMASVVCTNEREKYAHECEQHIAKKSEKVLDELLILEGIIQQQALKVGQILHADTSKLMLFSKCPHALKVVFVKNLLGGNEI